MLFPYKIDTIFKHYPVANWVIMAITIAAYFASLSASEVTLEVLALGGTHTTGIVTHMFMHGGLPHLAGNMVTLWIFGNAVSAMMGGFAYAGLYLLFGILSGAAHVAFDDNMAIGASGAINGVVGLAFAMYPRNAVSVFWFIVIRFGTGEVALWVLAALWLILDVWGALGANNEGIAYWAHLGGFAAGVATGLVALRMGWITLTHLDDPTLADLFKGKKKKTPITKGWAWEKPMTLRDD